MVRPFLQRCRDWKGVIARSDKNLLCMNKEVMLNMVEAAELLMEVIENSDQEGIGLYLDTDEWKALWARIEKVKSS